ncbi:hypothetical protein [Pseudodesulfovibrio indicus]|uniref:hypothetical protein n=1 Tax=Pseudodesulfovibrio indicus TaxID=1716143 RepID=UPI0029309553|nr:hypothetical protein [Pseudodesulfovibrio indicus]
MINPVAQGYGIQTIPQTTKSAPQDGETRSGAGGDKVTISEEARAMSAAASDRSAGGLGLLQTEMPLLKAEELENLTEEVSGRITALLLENDIPTSPPAELYVDSAGAVRVKGNHPNKERIEQALAEDKELSNDFRQVSAQTSIQEAGKRHTEFARAYAIDPEAAVARFAYLFDDIPDDPYTMTIGGEASARNG